MRNLFVAVLLIASSIACATEPKSWSQFLAGFQEGYFAAQPAFAVSQGRHEHDGRLPDWSALGLERQVAWLHEQQRLAKAFTDLTKEQKYQREYVLAVSDSDLFWLEGAKHPFTNPAYYLNSLDPGVYLTRPYAKPEVRLAAYVEYLKAIPATAAQIRANLKTPMSRTLLERGIGGFAGFAEFYRGDALKAFAAVKDKALQTQLKSATAPAAAAMQGLAEWLEREKPRATEDYALGAKLFSEMLWKTERVKTSLKDLEKVGRKDLARNQAALKEACAKYAPGSTPQACIEKAGANKPKGGAVEGARAQLSDLRKFLVEKKLVTIPGTEVALVDESPPYQRANFAYIDIPGPFDEGMPSTYYISPPDPSWPKAEQDAYVPGAADLLFTSVHEVWPGHFLQFLHAKRSAFQFGQVFVGYAFAEGWAHYTEEMMWDAGFGEGSPEIHIGQLSNALMRNARYLCAIGLHTQGMTVDACEKMFLEEAFQDPGNSRQQAARGTYDPAYLNYTMGKLMIMKLRADWIASRNGRDAWSQFHDQFLSFGGPPIPLVREQMLGTTKGDLF
jgi:uncharacterized protein (DUF885 family)